MGLASVEVVVAATNMKATLLAGLAILPTFVHAENIPERASISFKYLDYKDSQPGLERVSVKAPSARVLLPFADEWVIDAGLTFDAISGATPTYHSEKTSAASLEDERTVKDLRITRYFQNSTVSVSRTRSSESDYISDAQSVSGTYSTESRNTTFSWGIGEAKDTINVPAFDVNDRKKNTIDIMLGITQVITPVDIFQVSMTAYNGRGFYSDPYKQGELEYGRPRHREGAALLGKWNHHFVDNGTTLRTSYRYYRDSFDIRSHTVTGEWVIPYQAWSFTPSLRLYTQTAAAFYVDPQNAPLPTFNISNSPYFSQDQRLSAFGARTLGMKVARQWGKNWLFDVKYEDYQQKSKWALSGNSPGIDTFDAKVWQFGITHFF